ncbi:MAG: stage III sporulation protein AE [Candidatus Heteroscillospira sp.]
MKRFVFLLLAVWLFSVPALAVEDLEQGLGVAELEQALPEEAGEIFPELEADASVWDEALNMLWDWFAENSMPVLRGALSSAVSIIAILMLCAAAESLSGGVGPDYIALGGALGISAVAAGDVRSFIGLGEQTLRSLADFGAMLLPCVAAAGAAAGNAGASGAMYAATALFMELLLTLCSGVVMPLIHLYLAAVTARAALGTGALDAAVQVTKWLCVTAMTVLMTVFTAYFSVTGAVGSTSDAAAAKVAKAAISAALPVVGKIVSGAAGSVVASATVLRAGVGVFGLLAVMGVCAWPFLVLGVHYLVYKAAALIGTGLSGSRLGALIGGIGTAFGMVLGLTGCGALMLFFALVSGMKAVSPL